MGTTTKEIELAIEKTKHLLSTVSPERIRDEFLKGIKTAKNIPHFIGLISKFNLWDDIFPGLNVNKGITVNRREPAVLLATLLKNNEPSVLNKTLNKLTYSSEENKAVTSLVSLVGFTDPNQAFRVKKMLNKSGLSKDTVNLFNLISNRPSSAIVSKLMDFDLSVTGQQVQDELGISPGPEMGAAIEKMEIENFKRLL